MRHARTRAGVVAFALATSLFLAPAATAGAPGSDSADEAAAPSSATAAAAATRVARPPTRSKAPIRVMTRNIYLGVDIFRPLRAAQEAIDAGKTLPEILDAVANENDVARGIVDETDFHTRAQLLADEIARRKPDLVGLQEVALWRSGPMEIGRLGVPNATTVDYDFLAILLKALRERGVEYRKVVVGVRADVEAPAYDPARTRVRDVRLTMHDVILRLKGSVTVDRTKDKIFDTNLPVSLAGIQMNFDRGFQWADVHKGRRHFRFINTHLESASSDLALAQAKEVLRAAPRRKTVVMVCDCNSDPLNDSIKPEDTVPHKAPYDLLTGSGGFTDQWLRWAPAEEGWTAGLSERVKDTTPDGFDHRIDLVLARVPKGRPLTSKYGWITGNELSDRDPATGLWPSDHAGVVIRLNNFPRVARRR
ncbi:MAG: endonuclease/exonuclease/phosphatase family protein [Nocardioides sp.]|uniref:endonuclease/exonuclease/phosphatase family protein n=1 Tax=Nocardioides sp. TaxID=35761 RepID=UPI003F0DC2D6